MSPTPRLTLRAPSLEATHAVAAALAALSRSGDIILLAGEMGAGKTAFAQGFGRALGVTEPITSPTFTLVHSYDTGSVDAAPRRPVPPRPARRGRRPGARRARRVPRHRARRVGRRRRVDVRRAPRRAPRPRRRRRSTPALITITAGRPDVGPALGGARRRHGPAGRAMSDRCRAAHVDPRHRDGDRAGQRGARRARGRHRPVRGRPAAGATPRSSRRPSTSSAPRPTSASTRSGSSPSTSGPGLFTGMRVGLAAGKALALALRVPMIGISSLDLLAFPHRRSDRVVVPVIDARKGEVFYAMYRQVPGGLQQVVAAAGRTGRRARRRPARPQPGGAVRRRRRAALPRPRSSTASTARSPTTPTRRPARSSSWPTPGRCARSGSRPADIRPVYLRQPDAQINWATRASADDGTPGVRRCDDGGQA